MLLLPSLLHPCFLPLDHHLSLCNIVSPIFITEWMNIMCLLLRSSPCRSTPVSTLRLTYPPPSPAQPTKNRSRYSHFVSPH
ncbi:hypothetical protein BDV28DRAFT_28899 [Aspergillus coremiiformis]|uniref:Uncharacterized protein n=1 Tax=Aspergillus coremiiformis TaxID=138285 RepID=A0A5N6YZU4_9EURO|nr:hypothetical protein BDV28DRAFT_28899 [Aspergillus coremiiformis]